MNDEYKKPFVIAVGAGKGGVGKSAMTVHLALMFSTLGYKVGILDADIYGPSMSIMLPPEKKDSNEIPPFVVKGIKIVSLAYFSKWKDTHVIRAPIANALIKNFTHQVDWGEIDLLLIDLPPGTGDIHITLMQSLAITAALIVTTPQKVSLFDVEKTISMFQKMEVPILGVIENMSFFLDSLTGEKHFLFGSGGGESLQEKFSIPLLGKVPIDQLISETLDRGDSIFEERGSSLTKQMLWEIGLEIESKICDNRRELKKFSEVKEVDKTHFSCVVDGKTLLFSYAALQRYCPCARCLGLSANGVDPYLSIEQIERVGNYALRFRFTSGCDHGVYTWDLLQKLFLPSSLSLSS